MNIIAVAAIMVSSFITAYLIIYNEIKHCKSLDIALQMIPAIKNKALFYNAPFHEIINNIDDVFDGKLSFVRFSDEISEGKSVPEAWKNAVNNSNFHLDAKELNTLIQFGCNMCSCSREEISNIAESAIAELQEYRNTAIESRKIKSKSTAVVTVSMGIMIVLMFA